MLWPLATVLGSTAWEEDGVPGTPLVTDKARAWFALLSGGSTAAPGLP